MFDDNEKPKTLCDQNCNTRLIASFSGPILDNATVFEAKSEMPDEHSEYTVVASTDGGSKYGIRMSELYVTASRTCADGSITGRTVLGMVKVSER